MVAIGISGSYGGWNSGDEAILTAVLNAMREQVPDAEMVVFSRDPDHTRANHDGVRAVQGRDVSRDDVIPEIERLDLFILGGGGLLYDGEARDYLRDVRLAHERQIPTCTFAIGAGPLQEVEDRRMVAETLDQMDLVTVRDAGSKRVLEEVGVESTIEVTGDPALLLIPESVDESVIRQAGMEVGAPVVGMSVREPGQAAPHLDEQGYHQLLAHAADFVVDRFGAQILFIPMEFQDVRHSHAVIGNMFAADRAQVIKRGLGPRQMLGLMGHLEFVIAMRLHVLVFSALAGVPFLPLPYAPKVSSFVSDVGMQAQPAVRRESAGTLLASLDRTWDHRSEQRKHIKQRLPELQERADRTARLAASLLSDHRNG